MTNRYGGREGVTFSCRDGSMTNMLGGRGV